MKNLKNITLEMSLKPFQSVDPQAIGAVCRRVFDDWAPLLKHADQASVLLWVSDGSEILSYSGRMDDRLEWARYVGSASRSQQPDTDADPDGIGLHAAHYLFREDPPEFTYRDLACIVSELKKAGAKRLSLPIRVGIPFDPGPEFAESPFKYRLHPEILAGAAFGSKALVCCYHTLHADPNAYASFPNGIPEGTPVATFLGRQTKAFLNDMDFDYLWLSNGFGFGSEPWRPTGITYDGERFYPERLAEGRAKVVEFWSLFRKECSCRIETRGTNLTVGLDMATDGVNLAGIYDGGYDLLPPPNSPWAALDGNFGLELVGYLSRIARLPKGEGYLFRYYIHDPWWMNSPWLDRYEGAPHDIYLPLSLSRIDARGEVQTPDHLSLLTIDNTLGEMPQSCVLEPTAHLLNAYEHAPDEPPPVVWVYPFDDYCAGGRLEKPYFEDRFMTGAVNAGLPLSGVVDAGALPGCRETLKDAILISPMPKAGSPANGALIAHVQASGKAILYGALEGADGMLLNLLGLSAAAPLSGEMTIEGELLDPDQLEQGAYPRALYVDALRSDGGMEAVATGDCTVLAQVKQGGESRAFAVEAMGGNLLWLRGRNDGLHLHRERPADEYFPAEVLMRTLLSRFGWSILFEKPFTAARSPVVMISRNDNALYFSGYCPDTTVGIRLSTPLGAPILMGCETIPEGKVAHYRMPRAFHKECRAFIRQEGKSVVSCRELIPVDIHTTRRIQLIGLVDAEVILLPTKRMSSHVLYNSLYPYMTGKPLDIEKIDTPLGPAYKMNHVTGNLILSDERMTREEAAALRRPAFERYQGEVD